MGNGVRVRVLDHFSVSANGDEVQLRENAAQLLAYVCLHYEERNIPRDEIVRTLGLRGGPALSSALFQLRENLEPFGAQFSPDGSNELWIDVSSVDLDYASYDACLRHMDLSKPKRAVEKFLSAAEWFSGLPLAGWQYGWAIAEQARIEEEFWDDYHTLPRKIVSKSLRAMHIVPPFVSAVHRSLEGRKTPGLESPQDEFRALLEDLGKQKRFGLTTRAEDVLGKSLSKAGLSMAGVDERLAVLFKDLQTAAISRREELEKSGLVPEVDHLLRDCWDLRSIVDSIADHRVSVILAPPGFGKTTLACLVADFLKEEFHGGVWQVPLEDLGRESDNPSGEHVVAAIRNVFRSPTGGNKLADLEKHLTERSVLLILDACEAAPLSCSEVVGKLAQANDVKILLTTQSRLRVDEQNVIELKALATPAHDGDYCLAQLYKFPSAALFCMLWHKHGGRELTDSDSHLIARIVDLSRGIPLAITLAASMVDSSLEEIIECLRDHAWGGDEKAFLRRRIAKKLDLLSRPARDLFPRLAVFSGGWDRESATGICSDDHLSVSQVHTALTELCARSLLQRSPLTGRYSLLDLLRAVGTDRLTTDGLLDNFSKRHFEHYKNIAMLIGRYAKRADMPKYAARIELDGANMAKALGWADSNCPSEGALMCNSLVYAWGAKGYLSEGQRWLKRYSDVHGAALSEEASALLSHGRGMLAFLQSDYPSALRYCQQCMSSSGLADDHPANVLNLIVVGMAKFHATKTQRLIALDDFRRSVAIAEANAWDWELSLAAGDLALHLAMLVGDPPDGTPPTEVSGWRDEAVRYGLMGESAGRDSGSEWAISVALMNRASALRLLDFDEHHKLLGALYVEALRLRVRLHDRYGQNQTLYKLAAIASQKGSYKRAALILGGLGGLLGPEIPIPLHNQEDFKLTKEKTQTALGIEFEAVSAMGAGLSFSQLIDFALSERTDIT